MSYYAGKKVLITGINGFIGSHLAKALHAAGAQVEGTSRNPEKTPFLSRLVPGVNFPIYAVNFGQQENLDFLKEGKFDLIFHLASQSDTWESIHIPVNTFESNVNGTLHLLENIRVHSPNTPIIIAGSVRAFEPLTSSKVDVMAPLHPYDASKFCMQVIALSYFHAYKLKGAIAQNTNIYGPNDTNFNRLIPRMMQQLFTQGKISLKGNGNIRRDFLFVEDAVEGILRLGEHVEKPEVNGKSITFASGNLSSVKEMAAFVQKAAPSPVQVEFDGKAFEDRDHPRLDIDSTQKLLGWKPTRSLEEGLRETVEWYAQYFNSKEESK